MAILKRHCCHNETLYPLTLFDALKVILCIALVSFFSEISMHGQFLRLKLVFVPTFQETVGSYIKQETLYYNLYDKKIRKNQILKIISTSDNIFDQDKLNISYFCLPYIFLELDNYCIVFQCNLLLY